ncbi:MAG: Ig-like domain-containing protein, partial [Cyclobacteriaceae bacterium]
MKRLNYLILSSLITLSFNSYSQALIGATTQLSTIGTDTDIDVGSEKSAVAYSSSTEEYLIVWSSDNTNDDFGIYGQFVDGTTGVEVGSDFAIVASTASEDHTTPSVVYNATSDEFLVVWSSFISPTSYIYAQRVDEAGTLQGSVVTVASSSSVLSNPDVSYSATSDVYMVAFQNGSNSNVSVQVLNGATAALSGGNIHISDMAGGGVNNQQPKIAWNSVQNEFFVVWNTDPVTDEAFEIYGQRLDVAGADVAATTNIKISNVGDGDAATASSSPDVVYNPDDDEYFVVYSADVADGVFKIYGSVRDNVGAQVVAQTAYSTNSNGTFPQVEYNSINDQYLISFLDIQGTDSEVYGQLVTTVGAETGTDDFELIVRGTGDSDGLEAKPVGHGMTIGRLASYLVAQSAERITSEYEVFGQLWGISENDVAITRVDANPTKATTLNFSVDFSLPVTGFSASNLGITVSGVSGEALGTITGSGTSYNVPVDVTTGEGTVRLDMNNSTAIDLVVDNVPYTSGELYDVDLTEPLLSSSLPVAGSTNSYPSQDITLTFDDDMAKGTGNILIRELSGDAIVETIDVTSGSVTISTNVVTINPTSNLTKGVSYYLEVASGALTNTLITDYAGISGNSTLSFTVADVVINEVVLEPQFDWSPAFDGTDGASLVNAEDDWIELYINSTGVDFSVGTYPNKWVIEIDNGNDGTDYFGDLDVVGGNGSGAFEVSNYISGGSGTFNSTEPGDYLVLGNPFGANDLTNPVRVTLKDPGGAVVDEVIIGTGGFTDYVSNGVDTGASGTEAAFRRPNGTDTDTDNTDFFQNFASIGSENPNFPLITQATWLDENPQDGVVDRLQLDFNEAVNITDAGAGFDAITISGGITIDDQDYSDNTGTATSLTLDVSNVSTGTADPGVTVQYDIAGSSTIISNASANEVPNGETPDTYVDAAEPFVLSALTIDSGTPDGTIDEIEIEFSENVTDADVIPSDFALSTDAGSTSDGFNTRSTDVFSIATDAVANDQYIRLTITSPTNVTGTGAAQLSYTSTTSIDDAAGNVMSDFGFTSIGDGAAPILIGSTPDDEDIGVPGANDLTLNFSETVQAGTGNIEINGTNGPTYDVTTAGQLSFGSNLVINPDAPLESLTAYNLLVDATAITDGNGNDYAGLVAGDLNFITQANPPTISSATWLDANPQDGVIDQLRLDFGEAVDIDDQNAAGGFDPIVISGGVITIDNADYSDLSGTATSLILDVSGVTSGTADPGVTITYSDASSSSITSNAYGLEIVNGTSPSSIVDGALPVIVTALTIDDGDGTVDAMEIEFSEPILDAGISGVGGFADWTLDDGTNGATPFTGFSTAVTDLASDGDADDQYITLTINAGVSGTGAMSYAYSNTLGDITDASAQANVLADIGTTLANDGSAPIVLNAVTLDDGDGDVDALELEFSEPMNEASLSGNFSDWTLNDGTNGPAAFTGFSTQTDVVSGGTVNTSSDQYATLTISTGVVGTGVMNYAYGGVAITDNSAQAVALATITATAADDDAAPTITGYTLEGSNTYLDVNFSEDIYGSDGIIESVKADWTLTFDQNVGGGGTATAAEIGDITTTGDVVIPSNTGVSTIRFNLIFTGNQSGDELIAISPVDGASVADISPAINLMSGAQTTGNISVNTVTAVIFDISSSSNADNTEVNLVFSEGVGRNSGGSGALRYNDAGCNPGGGVDELCAEFVDPDGLLTETFASNAVSHSGGNSSLTFSFSLDGDADGNEYIRFRPADGNEIRGTTNGNMQATHFIDVPLSDEVPPTFASATYYDHDENGYIDEVVIVMSEPIDDSTIDPNDFIIGGTAATGIVTGGSIQNGIDTNTSDDDTFTLSANTQGTGGLTIAYTEDTAGTALADPTGNGAADDAGITATDLAAPVILSATTRDSDANGQIETIEVTFSEDVDFTTLDLGGADFTVTSPAYVITAAAQNGSNAADLTLTESGSTDVNVTPTITLLNGAIDDSVPNRTTGGDFSITATDGSDPYFASLDVNDPAGYYEGELMTLDIDMEETGLTLTVNLQNLNASLSSSQALADDGDGTYSYSLFVSSAMTEATGIVLPITATDGNSNSLLNSALTVDLDFTAPTVDITPVFTSDLSPALSGSVNDATATIEVSINGGGPYTATNAGATWSLAQGTITPDLTTNTTYSVTVTATDPAGNTTTDATNGEVKIDNTAPTITSINRSNPLVSTTNASTVVFRVTFDEGVKDVDASDFDISAFTATNTADAPVVSHISGGSVYDVTINNISGSGTLALDVSGATITDSLTVSPNAFAGTVGVSQSYEIDQTQPTVLSVVKKDANPTSAGTVNFRATFSEPVTNVTADGSDFDVNTSGPTIGAVAVTQVSSSIYDISVAVSGTSGDVFIESNAGQDITDLYGNGWDDTTVPSETYNIDYTAPSEDAASVSAIGQEATLSVDLNEAGTVYYVVLLSGDAAPAAASDIRDLTNNAASPEASGTLSIPSGASAYEASISLPDPKTGYVVYLALEDLASPTKNITVGSVLPITSGGVTLAAGALPSDLCLEGPSKTLSDITITEGINNDFRTGTGLKLRLNLPSGFEYDQTATVTTTGSTLNDISAVSFSYPASNTLQITYTVNSTTGADELVISGIEVQAVGSTAYASASIERGGGNAVIFGAEGTDNPVLGTVSSVVRPSGPSYAEDGTYTVGVSAGDTNGDDVALFTTATINKFGPGAITVLTIEPDGNNTGYTINIYDDEALTNNIYSQTGATSYTPTLTDFGRSATSYGIQTYYITQVDSPNGCESDPVEYSIAIAQINLSPNNTIFSESDTDGTTISINHQGSQTIAFSGNGLASIELGTNPATADFIPSAAGVSTGHVINFSMTNATSGELATFKRTFRVVAEANIFGSDNSYDIYAGNSFDCIESTNSSISIQDPYAGGNTNDGDPDFYELRFFAYKGDVSSTDVTASIVTNGTVGSAGAGTGVANNTKGNPDDWTIDPSLYTLGDGGIDTIAVALYTINETTDVISRQTQGLIYLYPLPTVTVDNIGIANSSDYFSEDDASTDISVSITSLGVTSSGTITNGFVLYEDTDDNGTYETQVKDYTATGIDGLNNTFDPAVEGVGKYEILYETPGQTIAGCTNTVTAQLEVVSKPGTPTINTALLADGKTDGFGSSDPGGAYYMVEYVGGNTLDDLTAEFAGATGDERFNWYTNSSLTTMVADATLSGTQKEVIDIPTALFAGISTPNTRQTKQLWLTVSDHVAIDGSTYEGAESDPIEVIIQVYPNPSIPVLTGDFPNVASATNELNKAQVGADFVFEYCVAAGGTATIETIELNTGTLNAEVDGITSEDYSSESYFTIWDGSTPVRENQVGTITAADLNALFGFDGSAGSLTFTVSQTDYDNNFDGSGFAFDGCESSERTFTIEVNEIPDAPNPDDFNGFNNSGVVEYYSCSGDALSTILTPQLSGSAYTWYEDNAGTPAASSLTIAAFNDNLVAESELTGFNRTVASETTVTYWVTQTTDFNNSGSGFLGCESDYTRVDITVYPDPAPISFDANGSGDLEISYCEGELGSVTFPITGDVSNSTFVYYGSDAAQTIQTAAVNLFGGDSDADGAVTVSSSDLLLANATQTNSPYYFLVAQTTNINPDGSDFDGCRTEVSDMAHLTVHVFDIPSTPSIADATLFYCEDDGVNEVTVTSSETGPVEYNWYEADTDGYPTGSPLLTETNSSGSSTINNVALGLDAAVNTPGVYRYVVSQTSDINSGNGTHDGCESSYRLVTITIYGTPNSPTVSDPLPQCQLEVTGTSTIIQYSGVSTDAGNTEFIWYDDAAGTNVIATIATANPTSSSNFTYGGITSFTPNGNDTVRSVYVRQVTNIQGGESFGGCESELSEVKLVVYPEPTTPTTIGNSGTTNLYEFCEGEDLTGIEIEIQGASVDEEYIWYPINTGNFQSAALDTASTLNILDFLDGEELSGKDFDINENIEGVTDYTFYVSKLTERQPALGFDGCESNLTSVTIRVNPLPQAPATGVFPDLNTEYCYDDGDITFGAQLVVDGTPVTPTSGTYDVISGGIGVITDNGDGTATINPESLALAVGETREGGSSTHSIEFVYTSDKGCEETFTKDITINAQPTLDIVYQNSTGLNSALDPLDASFICYEQGTFTIRGIQELNNATRGTFSISYEGSPVPNGNGFNDLGNGTAQIVSSNLMMFANEPNEGSPRDFTVTFTYGDDNTCDNSVSHTFTIEPQPTLDIQYEAAVVGFSDIGDALEGSTVCYDEGTITIGGEVSYLSGTVLDIEQSGQSDSIQFSINTGG